MGSNDTIRMNNYILASAIFLSFHFWFQHHLKLTRYIFVCNLTLGYVPIWLKFTISRMLRNSITRFPHIRNVKTVGSIIIGDEILKGFILDTNSNYLAKKLFPVGIKLVEVSILPDDSEIISKQIAEFSRGFDIVITSGGIGKVWTENCFFTG